VLVVEDNRDMLTFLGGLLGSLYSVVTAEDGQEGLDLARQRRPALVITDLMMPRMDGFELVSRMRADPSLADVPVVMLTARGEVEDRVSGRRSGVDSYIEKPFHSGELLAAVAGLLSTSAVRQREHRQRRDEAREGLVGGMARDILAPLRQLDEGLEELEERLSPLLDSEELSAAAKDSLADLLARGERARQVARGIDGSLKELRSLSGSALAMAPRSPVTVDDLVRRAIERAAPDRAVRDRIRTQLGSGVTLELPNLEMEQVVGHLLTNALEATHRGGRVDVFTRDEPDAVLIEVHDEGPGIPAEDLDRIFEPYYTTGLAAGRRGMGLALSRSVVEGCGGTLTVDSARELGAVFRVRLNRSSSG
jgi:DNA-binding response OmpR family regulator